MHRVLIFLESLILNLPFDFYLFQSDAADSAAPTLEDKILQFMVNLPLETERLRDFFGLEGKNLMMIVAKVRDLIRMQKPSIKAAHPAGQSLPELPPPHNRQDEKPRKWPASSRSGRLFQLAELFRSQTSSGMTVTCMRSSRST